MPEFAFPFITIFSDPGRGKTTDALLSWPDAAVIGRRNAIPDMVREFGVDPLAAGRLFEGHTTMEDIISIVQSLVATGLPNRAKCLIIDDATPAAEASTEAAEIRFPGEGDGVFRRWAYLKTSCTKRLRDLCAAAPFPVLVTAHETTAGTDERGRFHPGGPKFCARTHTRLWSELGTHVLRCVMSPRVKGDAEWAGRYWAPSGHTQWATKDRGSIFLGPDKMAPQNIGEALRLVRDWPRPEGLEDVESWVSDLARELLAEPKKAEKTIDIFRKELADDPQFLAWVLRDGVDRAAIYEFRRQHGLSVPG